MTRSPEIVDDDAYRATRRPEIVAADALATTLDVRVPWWGDDDARWLVKFEFTIAAGKLKTAPGELALQLVNALDNVVLFLLGEKRP